MVRISHSLVPKEYRDIVYRNLREACKGLSFRDVLVEVYARNNCRLPKSKHILPFKSPLNNSQVLSAINSLPYRMTIYKRMQKAILKKHFPKLYRIPYALSMLPPFAPMVVHVGTQKAVSWLYRHCFPDHPSPLLTTDDVYWTKQNLRMLHTLALNNLPSGFDPERVKTLFNNITASNCAFISKLCTHNILRSELD